MGGSSKTPGAVEEGLSVWFITDATLAVGCLSPIPKKLELKRHTLHRVGISDKPAAG